VLTEKTGIIVWANLSSTRAEPRTKDFVIKNSDAYVSRGNVMKCGEAAG